MKKVLMILTSALMFTGCAHVQEGVRRNFTSPAELAVEDCQKMGFKKGSSAFQQCVMTTSVNIRNARAASAASNKTVTCEPWLNGMRCTER